MHREAPLPPLLWDQIPPGVQAALRVVIAGYERRLATLEAEGAALRGEVRELRERLNQTSQNSSRAPSTDGPHVKRKPPQAPAGRKPGAQPGHPVHRRALVPLERVSEVIVCKPTHCRRCGRPVVGSDPAPWRQQVIEVPPPAPYVTEYQVHRLPCACCGITTCGELPAGVPNTGYGPRLASVVALGSGAYRMSKRMVASFCQEVLGVSLAVGEVCRIEQTVTQAVAPAVAEVHLYVQTHDTNVDETPWWEHQHRHWLWTVVTAQVSVFAIATSRGAAVLAALLGELYAGIVTSDRAKAYDTRPLRTRQLCWAHLARDFQAMIDRGGPAQAVGEALLEHAHVLFAWWHWVRDGTWRRSTFQQYVRTLRVSFRVELEKGRACGCPKTAATCRELLAREAALWTFVRVEGIEPTNNAAERQLRHAVQWRKTSYGTQSAQGSQFVAHILTVVTTCRQQGRNVLAYLTACCQASYAGQVGPSLVPHTSS
jgi:transposase